MGFGDHDPFRGAVPATLPLPNTPLTGVLVQVRFPEILSIDRVEFVSSFQERIRAEYPITRKDQGLFIQLGAGLPSAINWRFHDKLLHWRVTLTTSFVALETRAYVSRTDFVDRLEKVTASLEETVKPNIMTRIGARYVDRVHGYVLDDLDAYVRPEIVGLLTKTRRNGIVHTMNELVTNVDEGTMTARWGYMPANQTHEPDMMPAIAVPSWFLDVDVFEEFPQPEPFDVSAIKDKAMKLATRQYGFFRWAVNDEFLRAHGGEL